MVLADSNIKPPLKHCTVIGLAFITQSWGALLCLKVANKRVTWYSNSSGSAEWDWAQRLDEQLGYIWLEVVMRFRYCLSSHQGSYP